MKFIVKIPTTTQKTKFFMELIGMGKLKRRSLLSFHQRNRYSIVSCFQETVSFGCLDNLGILQAIVHYFGPW